MKAEMYVSKNKTVVWGKKYVNPNTNSSPTGDNVHPSRMVWSNILCTYEKDKTDIINVSDYYGSLREVEVTGIMEPSDTAKSNLIDILSSRKSIDN